MFKISGVVFRNGLEAPHNKDDSCNAEQTAVDWSSQTAVEGAQPTSEEDPKTERAEGRQREKHDNQRQWDLWLHRVPGE